MYLLNSLLSFVKHLFNSRNESSLC
jgi:hypothetical protein